MDPRRTTGRKAEDICVSRLRMRGWRILSRNWRIKPGELDVVAATERILVIVEVKAHRTGTFRGPVTPALAVGPNKQRRLRRLASAWIAAHGHRLDFREVRFDVVGITLADDGSVTSYEHIENAF